MKTQRTLVVGPSWIGDMVLAQSLFITLRRRDPEISIDVVAPRWSRAILARMPEVGDAVEVGVQHGELGLRKRYRVGQRLRDRGYDQAIVLPRSLKSALLPFFARIPRRTGYRGESRYGLINDMRPLDGSLCPQTVQRFVALGQAAGEPVPPPIPSPRLTLDEEGRERAVKRLGLSGDRPVIGLVPGAQYGSSRRWPAEKFGELAGKLVEEGYRVWIFGSAADREAAQTILSHCSGNVLDLTGRTELEEVVDLISLASVVVTNDTGLMHVAGAVGTRVVALYGATTPEHTPSLAESHRMIYRGIECSPCTARICPFGHKRCLTEIETGEVFEATRTLAQEPHILE